MQTAFRMLNWDGQLYIKCTRETKSLMLLACGSRPVQLQCQSTLILHQHLQSIHCMFKCHIKINIVNITTVICVHSVASSCSIEFDDSWDHLSQMVNVFATFLSINCIPEMFDPYYKLGFVSWFDLMSDIFFEFGL